LKSIYFAIGLILAIVGVVLIVIPHVPVSGSSLLFDDSFVVPGGMHYYYYATFYSPTTIHISFDVTEGGDRSVDFLVMDETNYQRMSEGQAYEYYTAPSRHSISKTDIKWVPPTNKKIYFVWDNSLSFDSRLVSATFSYEHDQALLPPLASTFGIAVLSGGLATVSYGIHPLTPSSSRIHIILGYIFAILGGVIGIILGMGLAREENEDDKFHGKSIVVISLLAISLYVLDTLVFMRVLG